MFTGLSGGDGGIRTHGPVLPAKRFRVVLVMTSSIRLHMLSLNFRKNLKGRKAGQNNEIFNFSN